MLPFTPTSILSRATRHVLSRCLRSRPLAVFGGALAIMFLPVPAAGGPAGIKDALSAVWASASALELDGDSSLHRYTLKAHDMDVGIVLDDVRIAQADHAPAIQALIVGHFIKTFQLIVP